MASLTLTVRTNVTSHDAGDDETVTTAQVGLSLTVPLAFASDALLGHGAM